MMKFTALLLAINGVSALMQFKTCDGTYLVGCTACMLGSIEASCATCAPGYTQKDKLGSNPPSKVCSKDVTPPKTCQAGTQTPLPFPNCIQCVSPTLIAQCAVCEADYYVLNGHCVKIPTATCMVGTQTPIKFEYCTSCVVDGASARCVWCVGGWSPGFNGQCAPVSPVHV